MSSPISDERLARLTRAREEADAYYNDALTALHRAMPGNAPQPPLDDETLKLWAVAGSDPVAPLTGWRRRLAGFVWRLVGPMLQQQQQYNHVLAYHVVRPVQAFHQQLMHYLQQVTLFVESKDREAVARMDGYLRDGMSALADEMAKRWESMAAREQRYDTRVSSLAQGHAELRTALGSLQQMSQMLKREMERLLASRADLSPPAAGPVGRMADSAPALDAFKYVGFEDEFRGSVEEIRARLCDYLPLFAGASDVLDVGCGRGEFLQLLADQGVRARGVDLNHEMVEACRARGLDVVEGDGVAHLATLPDGALGGLFAAQVVEHLEPDRLLRLLGLAFDKVRPGGRVVLETINPACWSAFFDSYIRDLSHVRAVHPDTLKYLLLASGFQQTTIEYRAPYPEPSRLQPVAVPAPPSGAAPADGALLDLVETFNANVARLNAQLFTYRDYAAIARRP